MTEAVIIQKWFLYDNGLCHERANDDTDTVITDTITVTV